MTHGFAVFHDPDDACFDLMFSFFVDLTFSLFSFLCGFHPAAAPTA